MSTTDEELSQLLTEVEDKRSKLADTKAAREELAQSSLNDIRKAELQAESARLDRAIADEQEALERQLAGATSSTDEARAAMEQAVAAQEAARVQAEVEAQAEAEALAAAEAAAAEAAAQTEGI
jgi:hypothetical protein